MFQSSAPEKALSPLLYISSTSLQLSMNSYIYLNSVYTLIRPWILIVRKHRWRRYCYADFMAGLTLCKLAGVPPAISFLSYQGPGTYDKQSMDVDFGIPLAWILHFIKPSRKQNKVDMIKSNRKNEACLEIGKIISRRN